MDLALSINEYMFESFDSNHRARSDSFLGVRMEIRRMVDLGAFGIAMDVGQHREHTRGVIPEDLASCFPHRDQLPEAEWSGIDSEDPCQVPDELIHFCASVSGLSVSRIFSAC